MADAFQLPKFILTPTGLIQQTLVGATTGPADTSPPTPPNPLDAGKVVVLNANGAINTALTGGGGGGGGSTDFSQITGLYPNVTAAMVVGNGASLTFIDGVDGNGVIDANYLLGAVMQYPTVTGQVLTAVMTSPPMSPPVLSYLDWTTPTGGVTSVNGQTGAVVLVLPQTFNATSPPQFFKAYNSSMGLFTAAQPSFSGILGTVGISQLSGTYNISISGTASTITGTVPYSQVTDTPQLPQSFVLTSPPTFVTSYNAGTGSFSGQTTIPYTSISGTPNLNVYALLSGATFTGTVQAPTVNVTTSLSLNGTVSLLDGTGSAGTSGYVLSSTGSATAWVPQTGGSGNKTSRGTNASFKSSPPASPNSGDTFICSDSPFSYVYDGAEWQAYVFGYNVQEPTPATVTVIDGSGGSYTQDTSHGGYIIQCPANSGGGSTNLAIVEAIPASGAYYVDVAFMTFIPFQNGGAGVCLTDGTTTSNKLTSMRNGFESGTWPMLERQRWNNFSSFNANYAMFQGGSLQPYLFYGSPLVWFRIYDDRTNVTYYISSNGYVWDKLYQESRTAWLTPADGGFVFSPFAPYAPMDAHL